MYCKHCGKQIADESKFCPFCGTDLQDVTRVLKTSDVIENLENTTQTTTQNVVIPPVTPMYQEPVLQRSQKSKLPLIIGGVILLALLFGVYSLFFSRKSINPKDFITVNVDNALNGYANAQVDINYDKLTELIGEKNFKNAVKSMMTEDEKKFIQSSGSSVSAYLDSPMAKAMYYAPFFVNVNYDNATNLSNGQEITFTFDTSTGLYSFDEITKMLNIKLPKEYKYKVSGLEEGKTINILIPNIENYVSFYGANGSGSAVLGWNDATYNFENDYQVKMMNNIGQVTHNGNIVGSILYEVVGENGKNVDGGLSQGDTIKVTATPDSSLVAELMNNKLSATNNSVDIKVDKIIEYEALDNLDRNQVLAIGEEVVLYARNALAKYSPYVKEEFSIRNKKTGATGFAYLIGTSEKEYYVITQDVRKDPNTNKLVANGFKMDSIGKSDNISNFLKDYDLYIMGNEVNGQTYAVGKQAKITMEGVRVRSGPSTNSTHVKINNKAAYYDNGEVVKIVEETRDSENNLWYKVEFKRNGNTYTYWASGMYVEILTNQMY